MAVVQELPSRPTEVDWMAVWPEAEAAVHRTVRGRLPLGVEPEDISQQVFVDLLRAGRNAPPPDRLRFWCVAVARRVVADIYRRKTVPVEDLALAPVVDIESVALTRLRCEAAASAYADLREADRSALAASDDGPASNKVKLRRSRARRTLRERAERLVGGALLIPRWGWLAGTTGAAAIIVPLCLGLGGPGVDTAPDTSQGTPVTTAPSDVGAAPLAVGPPPRPEATTVAAHPVPTSPAAAAAAEPTYHRRVRVPLPGGGAAGYDHYEPPVAAEPPPVACARNLQVSDSVCVDHPVR